jgi:hypothetical protein
MEGYALDFVINFDQYLTKVLEFFKKGPCRKLIEEISVWPKDVNGGMGYVSKPH